MSKKVRKNIGVGLLFLGILALAPHLESKEVFRANYSVIYRFGGIDVYQPADVVLVVSQETWLGKPAWFIRFQANPPAHKKPSKRIQFTSRFQSVLDAQTFRILYYQKEVQENIQLIVFRSRKDYTEEVYYYETHAQIKRKDYLTHQIQAHDVDLDASSQPELINLPALMGKAIFQEGYLHALEQGPNIIRAKMVTQSQVYPFDLHLQKDWVKRKPKTKFPALRVSSKAVLKTLDQEMAPFRIWFVKQGDLPQKYEHIYSIPMNMHLKFSLGALKVELLEVIASD